jgi:myosin heavy subunit
MTNEELKKEDMKMTKRFVQEVTKRMTQEPKAKHETVMGAKSAITSADIKSGIRPYDVETKEYAEVQRERVKETKKELKEAINKRMREEMEEEKFKEKVKKFKRSHTPYAKAKKELEEIKREKSIFERPESAYGYAGTAKKKGKQVAGGFKSLGRAHQKLTTPKGPYTVIKKGRGGTSRRKAKRRHTGTLTPRRKIYGITHFGGEHFRKTKRAVPRRAVRRIPGRMASPTTHFHKSVRWGRTVTRTKRNNGRSLGKLQYLGRRHR